MFGLYSEFVSLPKLYVTSIPFWYIFALQFGQ